MMRWLYGFACGLGLDEATTLPIVERVAADMPVHTDAERLVAARTRMIETVA